MKIQYQLVHSVDVFVHYKNIKKKQTKKAYNLEILWSLIEAIGSLGKKYLEAAFNASKLNVTNITCAKIAFNLE